MAVIAGCGGGNGGDTPTLERAGGEHLVPAWEPEVDAAGDPEPADDPAPAGPGDATAEPPPEPALPGAGEPAGDQAATVPPAGGDAPPADGPVAPVSVSITDPRGDVTGSTLEPPPAWVDLLGATLTRSVGGWELRVRVAGGQAPDSSGSRQHTMNLAFFADLDGNGAVDAQIWANLADHGWGAGWFPPEPPNRFGDESGIVITTEADEVVLRFPASHLPVERLRWSVATEWGRYEALGTDLTARDRAPDTGPAQFP
jgi:hypothetical protein